MSFLQSAKCIVTDSHFLVPFFVLLAGIALLVALH
jgi:hypothetical protein